ncbi:ABC transporter permease [Vagococcus fluvialis]|uniref:ABC transporter permease n=1 Tax=Vagococcus fluvialis TaxID=2738 RepID=UPI001D09B444|nr:ABC transporter permease [Vagococcus fluvialis]MDT2747338.1 ABC transporter permease [Vagococcus fluvialis]UDM72342.1 ABC transporter permease [Vagococcus fluvialis]UDM73138.1 ABC transporter permease [Vagococcus fluvialis]UDM77206.1 ABC transporter permease [Vagococcus fluvialis]UDM81476.1 ABC transporter permease [Vagococcus fluvialis]
MIVSTIAQGFLWAVLGLGIYLTFRILNFPDLTTEGSFPLGGAVCVTAITNGVSPILATLLGVGAGMLAGLVTGLLYTKGKIPIILSGILVMSALNSVMLFIMKSPNLSLLNQKKLFNSLDFLNLPPNYDKIIISLIVLVIVIGGILLFLYTDLGQAYVATGDNEEMAKSFGINTDRMKILGLMISNGIIGLAGALIAQSEGYADVNKGIGVIVIGLASIILGELLFGELTLSERLIAIVLGSVLYQLLILLVIKLKLDTTYLKLYSSVILAICLMFPQIKQRILPTKEAK